VLELQSRIFQLYTTVSSSTIIYGAYLGTTVHSLICCLEHCKCTVSWTDSSDLLNLMNKTANVLSTIVSICSSLNELICESTLASTTLASSLKCLEYIIKEFSPAAAEDNCFPLFVNGFGSRDLLVNVLKTFSLIVCDIQNRSHFTKKEFMETFGFSSKDVALMFRSILFCYKNDFDVIQYVLKIVAVSCEKDHSYTLLLFFGFAVPVDDAPSTCENDEFLRLLLHLLTANVENTLIVASGLSIINSCFREGVVASAFSQKLRSMLNTVMKHYHEKRSGAEISGEIMVSLYSILKTMRHLRNETEKDIGSASFTALEMKEFGYSMKEVKEISYTLIELKEAGYSLQELSEGGFLVSELKEHYLLEDLLSSGVIASSGVDLKKVGYSIEQVKKAGKTAAEMKNYYSLDEIKDEYCLTLKALRDLGYDAAAFAGGFESSVVLKPSFILDLLSLLPPTFSSASLLYRGSRDGFDKSVYHAKCANQGPHLLIVKCDERHIFGGYMGVGIPTVSAGTGVWVADPSNSSFLFTLMNPRGQIAKKYPIKPEGNAHTLYAAPSGCGFYFGHPGEIITLDMKTVQLHVGSTYESYHEGDLRFTGRINSKRAEVEVWKIVNN
jgi:biotin operon repressor